jgi:cytochrome c553
MVNIARLLSEQDMRDVAAYYAILPLPPAEPVGEVSAPAVALVREGDPKRLITPCASCHGVAGEGGINETPALAGQVPEYFVRTMQAFRAHQRDNDLYQGMAQFTHRLSDEEIEALARYYAALGR